MRRVGLPRLRVPVVGACLAALTLAGCGTGGAPSNSAVTVSGTTLSIWASEPPGSSGGQVATDVLDAEQLAFTQSSAKASSFHLRFEVTHADEISADARNAISDKTAIAYLGEIPPGSTGVSLQITNELGLLQVSPTDTAVYLTQPTSAVPGAPRHFYPAHANFHETFDRVVPTTAAEAKVLVARMRAEHLTTLDVGDDGSEYGKSIALEVSHDASAAGLSVSASASGADAVFYGGLPGPAATSALDAAATAAPSAKLFAPSALYDDTFVAGLSSAAQSALTVSAPGFMPASLDAEGTQFEHSFTTKYGHAPAPQAIFGYEAMKAVLAVLTQAGAHASSRQLVVGDFRDLKRTAAESALGAYSINGGDTNIAPFILAGVSGGKLVPRAAG